MVPMETQLQSIFEEVVVSATVGNPGQWLREGQAADLGCGPGPAPRVDYGD